MDFVIKSEIFRLVGGEKVRGGRLGSEGAEATASGELTCNSCFPAFEVSHALLLDGVVSADDGVCPQRILQPGVLGCRDLDLGHLQHGVFSRRFRRWRG